MVNYISQIIIALISSGALGVIVTALVKKRERNSNENIKNIVNAQTLGLQTTIAEIQKIQVELAKQLEENARVIAEIQKELKQYRQELTELQNESREIDLIIVKALRNAKLINGESDEIYAKMIDCDRRRKQYGDSK